MKKILFIIIIAAITIALLMQQKKSTLPLVAIANYGPHASLENTVIGIQQSLENKGFIEGKNIEYSITDVGFDTSLIPQMITKLKTQQPKVLVTLTTPISQFAKNAVKDIPLVFVDVTDPVAAGLLKDENKPDGNMTGVSERQDLDFVLSTAKQMLKKADRVGVLYSTSENNDQALVEMLKKAAMKLNMQVVAIPVDQPRDVQQRMQNFKGEIDFLYVGTSGAIQPTLPVIAIEADKMNIPIFNADPDAVKNNLVLASIGVNYKKIGISAGNIVVHILKTGESLPPIFPQLEDHQIFINKQRAERLGIIIPANAIME